MVNRSRQPDNTFIVRFWWERGVEQSTWYGNVHHIQSGKNISFRDQQEMIRFIEQYIPLEERKRGHLYPFQDKEQ
ncbi:MAG: hypothetical protein ACPL4H_09740 [Anaerolineales bacterium]